MNKSKILLISAIALAVCSCDNAKTADSAAAADSTKVVAEAHETDINIRYVSMDTIQLYYTLAQNTQAQVQKLVTDLQSYQLSLQNQLQSQQNLIQQKAQSNQYLSEASYQADINELNKKANSLQNAYAKREQAVAAQIDQLQKEYMDSINNFIIAYNKDKKYDAILFENAGLYFNPALDITQEIVDGLNARYTGKAIEGAAAAATTTPASLTTPGGIKNPAAVPTIGK